jgi:hypothetical protein
MLNVWAKLRKDPYAGETKKRRKISSFLISNI